MPTQRLLALATAAVLVAAVAALGVSGHSRAAAGTARFPSPPAGSTVYSHQLGGEAVALAVLPQGAHGVLLEASVLGPQGGGVTGLHVTFALAGRHKVAAACGPGCYRSTFTFTRPPSAVDVGLPGASSPWHVVLPTAWPPRDATALVAAAGRTWRRLHSLTFRETLASDSRHAAVSTWRVQAPNRLAYQVDGGWAGVVIGARRWDRAPGATTWQSSAQTPLHQPVPFWVAVADAHVVGSLNVRGKPAVRVSFFDPGSPAWFTIVLDRATFRTLDSRMVTTAHFMHDAYRAFDSTAPVIAPN